MKEKMMFQKNLALATLCCVLVFAGMGSVWAASNDLFEHTVLKGEQLKTAASIVTDKPVVLNVSFVRGKLDLSKAAGKVNLNLFPGAQIVMNKVKVDQRGPANFSWFGRGSSADSHAIIVVNGKRMAGTVHAGGKLYKMVSLEDNLVMVQQLDARTFPNDHPPEFSKMEKKARLLSKLNVSSDVSGSSGTVITVLVAYTRLAQLREGNVELLAQLAVDETNTS